MLIIKQAYATKFAPLGQRGEAELPSSKVWIKLLACPCQTSKTELLQAFFPAISSALSLGLLLSVTNDNRAFSSPQAGKSLSDNFPEGKWIAFYLWRHKLPQLVTSEERCVRWKGTCKSKIFFCKHAVHALGQWFRVGCGAGDSCAQNNLPPCGGWEVWNGARVESSLVWWTWSPQFFVKWRHCRNLK